VESGSVAKDPTWFRIGNGLIWPLIGMGVAVARSVGLSAELKPIPELAICHHAGCVEAAGYANQRGKHSAAMSLVRQSLEALTVAEIGLQDPTFAEPLLAAWKKGKKSQGELRKALEQKIWPEYGVGLWDELWTEFHKNLAQAVQPYAHYSPELQGWQFATLSVDYDEKSALNVSAIEMAGLETYDPLKATRITFFHMLLTWMLGRILLAEGRSRDVMARRQEIVRLGRALGASKLLFRRADWWAQFTPNLWFKPGRDWMDEA
jgi:hypothetical protein